MLIEAPLVPELESRFDVEIRHGERLLRTAVRVAHVEEVDAQGEEPRAEIGVEFLSLADEDRDALQALLAEEREGKPDEP